MLEPTSLKENVNKIRIDDFKRVNNNLHNFKLSKSDFIFFNHKRIRSEIRDK